MLASLGKKKGSRAEIWDRFFPRRAPSGGFFNCTTPTASSVEVSIPSSSVSSFSLSPRFLRSPIDSNKHLLFYDALCRGNEKTGVDCAALSLLGNACLEDSLIENVDRITSFSSPRNSESFPLCKNSRKQPAVLCGGRAPIALDGGPLALA